MNEHENKYRGCRLHRYLAAKAALAERRALHEAIRRVDTEGVTQIVLLSCYEVDTISRLDAAKLRRAAEKRRAWRIRQLIQTVCCWLSTAYLFVAWGVAGSAECGTRPMCWTTALHMAGWITAFGIFAWIGGLMDRWTPRSLRPSPVKTKTTPSKARRLQPQAKGVLTQ